MNSHKLSRESIFEDIKSVQSNHILCELPTGTGKSKIALDFLHFKNIQGKILIVVPRLVLINNWIDEFKKWGYDSYLNNVEFTTYISVVKFANKHFDIVIFDEAHHLTERAISGVETIISTYTILLSATVTKEHKITLKSIWPDLYVYTVRMRQAIEDNILPDPKVVLIQLKLNNTDITESYVLNPKSSNLPIPISYNDRFKYLKSKTRCIVKCTQQQYYDMLSYEVDKCKSLYHRTGNKGFYFMWQKAAGDRLKYLSSIKNETALRILRGLDNYRTLTFCNSIEQTKQLGKYCINSANDKSIEYLDKFNRHKINHITACNMVNEGVNLVDCQVGIFVAINSSDIMIKQKNGRILRHQKPIIIIPYYTGTREEEIVDKMLLNYNPSLVVKAKTLRELKNEVSNR